MYALKIATTAALVLGAYAQSSSGAIPSLTPCLTNCITTAAQQNGCSSIRCAART
ncbi:hypothetical protein OE88DRAFT_1669254 [Heliocybe sulcata]|uniref:Extracellular membrane protein CFEM domain-containing protein n=1 Tax=Heliocybe sulcata TaxID=5364 RepID=A0A5C3MKG6_9AGAM|nr:hypothetical protein OE88DRAFT_1669254 [Heliocybe sulcata]